MKTKNLIAFLLFIAFSSPVFSQFTRPNFSYGTIQNRIAIDSAFFYPTGCGTPTSLKSVFMFRSALYFDSCAHKTWVYDPKLKSWDSLRLDGNDLSQTVTNVYKRADSVFVEFGGTTEAFRFRVDTAGGGGDGWSLTGNELTDPGTNFIGTKDMVDLVFKTNTEEAMRIRGGTNIIKIGSTDDYLMSPFDYSLLQVIQDRDGLSGLGTKNLNSGTLARAGISASSNTGNYILMSANSSVFRAKPGDTAWQNVSTIQGGGAGRGMVIATSEGSIEINPLRRKDGNPDSIDYNTPAIFASGDNRHGVYYRKAPVGTIGLGTRSPIAHLHVKADTLSDLSAPDYKKALYVSAVMPSSVSSEFSAVEFAITGATGAKKLFDVKNNGSSVFKVGNDTTGIIGNVGIGTMNPTAKLHVVGDVKITGIPNGGASDDSVLVITSTGDVKKRNAASIGGTSGWGLTGNTGTTAGTNFIGTTDNIDLVLKRNGVESGRIASDNTGFGREAMTSVGSGSANSAFGSYALTANSGVRNTGIGFQAIGFNSSGDNNTGVGYTAIINSTGSNNIGIGSRAGGYNTSGSGHLFINSYDRSNAAGDTTGSIIYGQQSSTVSAQRLRLNAQLFAPYLPSGGVAADSVVVVASDGTLKKRDAATFGGGGSTPTLQQVLTAGNLGTTAIIDSSIIGQSSSGGYLRLTSTSNATKGQIKFGSDGRMQYDEANHRLTSSSAAGQLRYTLGETSAGMQLSTRDGQLSIGTIESGSNFGLRILGDGTGFCYIDGMTAGTTQSVNYPIIFGSRLNNAGLLKTGNTTTETGSNVQFGFETPDTANVLVRFNSTTKGILFPKQTNAQISAISGTIPQGLKVYSTTDSVGKTYIGGVFLDDAKLIKGSATIDFDNTNGGAISDKTFTVTGARPGDQVLITTTDGSYPSVGTITAFVSGTNTITARFANNSGLTTVDFPSTVFKYQVLKQ